MNAPEHRPLLPALVARDRIIAVLRAPDSTYLIDVALALAEEGIGCIEVTLTTAGAIESIHTLRSRLDGDTCAVGAGSVLTVGDLEAAHSAGATYTLAPTLDLDVLSRAHQLGIAHVPGVATPTEALTAWRAGAAAVKVFPASQLGGPSYVKALLGPLPDIKLIPTGGVGPDDATSYLNAGAVAVGVGGSLTGDALINGPDDAFRNRVRHFVTGIRDDV
jgi:2-dehydro-3-deoxyphosphogluconate aldolase/(4S)-4-hydroxy-2-oxoglutarate aldolase